LANQSLGQRELIAFEQEFVLDEEKRGVVRDLQGADRPDPVATGKSCAFRRGGAAIHDDTPVSRLAFQSHGSTTQNRTLT
jgi:hypothetical protein